MKSLLLAFITIYQRYISPLFKQLTGTSAQCRFYPTCSMYAKSAIEQEGAVKGCIMAIKRIMRCQPFSKAVAA